MGAGFSASMLKILTGDRTKIIGSFNHNNLEAQKYLRRKNLECNKLMSKKTYSYGSLQYDLRNAKFHDRLSLGGNSNIWGGKINIKKIPKKILKLFNKNNIKFEKLSFKNTGTISNNKNIYQIQTMDSKILKIENIPINIKNGHIISFFNKKKKLYVNIKFSKKKIKTIFLNKLFLCIGSVQLLDLLYRSNYIKDGDTIEFSEFSHKFKWKSIFSFYDKKATVVRYHFCRALGHYFGIQFFAKYLKALRFIPICIDQNFYNKKNNYKLLIKNGKVIDAKNQNTNNLFFGSSIHYCNMRINKIDINKYLSKINPNILGIGMSFINQKNPGPISNDILIDTLNKIKKSKIKINY